MWPLTVLTLRSLFRRLVHTRSKPKTTEKHPTDPNCVYYKQSSLFHKSVKLKKRHEIEQFATNCSRENNCRTLVDIGSGQGNLARTLAYGFGFRVCCLEQNESFVQAARYRKNQTKTKYDCSHSSSTSSTGKRTQNSGVG